MTGVPTWIISAAAAGAIGFFAGWSWNGARHDAERASEKAEAVQTVRTEEIRRTETIDKVVQDVAPKLEAIRVDADSARDELDGLRRTADQYARRLASCSTTAERSEATIRAAMVLSDMLSRSEARNIELAAAFDDARQRGLTCQAAYQALRPDSRSSSASMPR